MVEMSRKLELFTLVAQSDNIQSDNRERINISTIKFPFSTIIVQGPRHKNSAIHSDWDSPPPVNVIILISDRPAPGWFYCPSAQQH